VEINEIALALSMTCNVVPGDWNRLDGTPSEIWDLLQRDDGLAHLGRHLGHAVGPVDWAGFEEQRARVARCNARVASRWDAAYPWLLRQVASPPPVLFTRGNTALLQERSVAVVGTRAPSSAGVAFTIRLARGRERSRARHRYRRASRCARSTGGCDGRRAGYRRRHRVSARERGSHAPRD